uniref:Uncharacterized protein n=1 Tax=Arundo donax TaxID=35708 RepID=A0A0A9CDK3_ARUDO
MIFKRVIELRAFFRAVDLRCEMCQMVEQKLSK